MAVKGINRVNSFLVEIIIVILFFSLSAAVTLQVFVTTHKKGEQSTNLNMAVVLTQQMTEQYRANGEDCSWCSSPEIREGATVYTVEYDEDWNPVSENGSFKLYFKVSVVSSDSAGTVYETVAEAVSAQGESEETVYRLPSRQYVANI